jgi:hypothetical protein
MMSPQDSVFAVLVLKTTSTLRLRILTLSHLMLSLLWLHRCLLLTTVSLMVLAQLMRLVRPPPLLTLTLMMVVRVHYNWHYHLNTVPATFSVFPFFRDDALYCI